MQRRNPCDFLRIRLHIRSALCYLCVNGSNEAYHHFLSAFSTEHGVWQEGHSGLILYIFLPLSEWIFPDDTAVIHSFIHLLVFLPHGI